jgi:hypothetical protein
MVAFLKIENPGVCPPEGFTLFGATTKRRYYSGDAKNDLIIGTFGSGNKHSVCVLLRSKINPVVFCGSQRLSFFTRDVTIKGVAGSSTSDRVCVRYGGKTEAGRSITKEEELSVTLDYGTSDWEEISLALRELVSNSLDACFEQGMDVAQAVKAVCVEVVEENQVRAKAGCTRVFIPLTPGVEDFYNKLGRWFLHFSEPALVTETILPKARRSHEGKEVACIYRRGVYVREWTADDVPSLFDYNLANLRLNESRTAGDWDVRHACGSALAGASKEQLACIFRGLRSGSDFWEAHFDTYGLDSQYEAHSVQEERKERWQAAFKAVAGEDGVLMSDQHSDLTDTVSRKGYTPVATKADGWVKAGERMGIKSDVQVLTEDDKKGRTYSAATPAVEAALDWVWEVVDSCNMTAGKDKPKPGCFWEPMKAESQTWGLQKGNEVLIHTEIAGSITDMLRWVMLEEVGHYVTGATDMSRDFQTFFIRLASKLALSLTAPVPFRE